MSGAGSDFADFVEKLHRIAVLLQHKGSKVGVWQARAEGCNKFGYGDTPKQAVQRAIEIADGIDEDW